MSVPSMVHRSGNKLIVRSVVSGDALYHDQIPNGKNEPPTIESPRFSPSSPCIQTEHASDLPDCKVKRNYSCSSCDYFTQNPRHYLYHLREVHKEKVRIYECSNCLYASKHFQKLLRHSKMVHGDEPAPEPARVRTRKRSAPPPPPAAQHASDDENDAKGAGALRCSVCAFVAKTQTQLAKHEREEHIKTKFFRCSKCTYVTHMKARFTKHVKYHSMPMIKCDMCDFRTPYKWNLDRHCKNHNGRGTFRCSACNFTADIKQSLTVHEMNHHVPPVGQAAGFGVGRRRNKVGASDAAAAEDLAVLERTATTSVSTQVALDDRSHATAAAAPTPPDNAPTNNNKAKLRPSKKSRTFPSQHEPQSDNPFGADFLDPDDIIHHANGNVYIKNKCKLCNFKSAWDGEMAKHEAKVHGNPGNDLIASNIIKATKKTQRPIPNLIPIPFARLVQRHDIKNSEPVISQKDFNDICAKSGNSALKDFAPLLGADVFPKIIKAETPLRIIPDLIPTKMLKTSGNNAFKQKNASFFDKLKEKLSGASSDLTCKCCGHESKCLSEQMKHQNSCGKETCQVMNFVHNYKNSSTRCQYCRQRCKSSNDLHNHLTTCIQAQNTLNRMAQEEINSMSMDCKNLKQEYINHAELIKEQDMNGELVIKEENEIHPMENKVFVWNNIEVPMDIEVDDSSYEYTEDKGDDNYSVDLSTRPQSRGSSENSYVESDQQNYHHPAPAPVSTEKIPTHGTDISVAQHKRVFQCPHCTFWASTASRFHVHIVGHLNKKPFECSLCSYRSNWRWDITKHIKLKSVRDPSHENAKVLMTDETGRRNYTKYNKYLTEIHVSGDQSLDTSGGSGTRHRNHHEKTGKNGDGARGSRGGGGRATPDLGGTPKNATLRPPPALKAADAAYFAKNADRGGSGADSKRTLFKCKKCNYRDASREVLLDHVKGHYANTLPSSAGAADESPPPPPRPPSMEKDQRHCRLKHAGDIRVVCNKNGQEKMEIEEQTDEPDHNDLPQLGLHKCSSCPFSTNAKEDLDDHLEGHEQPNSDATKCCYCNFYGTQKENLVDHMKLHGVNDPEEFVERLSEKIDDQGKKFRCITCPYVTNSKSQYTYHKQFHKPKGYQYACSKCSYNVSKRHLLHQHLKVHGVGIPSQKSEDIIDLDEMNDEIEELPATITTNDYQNLPEIPLVWVSKGDKFTKMYKCRYCPHVNLRKVNIQEHEKMHSVRGRNTGAKSANEVEHHCSECNYVCNNAGVLSSHSKVHQGLCGTVHCLVDPTKSDAEQIRELKYVGMADDSVLFDDCESPDNFGLEIHETADSGDTLYFCKECPARFLKENEYEIHTQFHGFRLFYKCEHCTYTAREKPHLLSHSKIHSSEYQERTKILQRNHQTSGRHPQPQIYAITPNRSETIWVAVPNNRMQKDQDDISPHHIVHSRPSKSVNIPLSGTELFQQKSEAQQKQAAEMAAQIIREKEPNAPPLKSDPQFGTLMHGNPIFKYPTCLKNGKVKEKRYKCHKCPSAFEKREQYKVHLGLHGSKQKYVCESCDYSVKYYANFSQHLKKHRDNDQAQLDIVHESEGEENDEVTSENAPEAVEIDDSPNPSPIDLSDNGQDLVEERLFSCQLCPYSNYRKDAVDNHQKRHIRISGIKNNYTCEFCDYSVPQAHFLRDHIKLHVKPNKEFSQDNSSENNNKSTVGRSSREISEKFNNNKGERQSRERCTSSKQ